MIFGYLKADVKEQEIKELVALSWNFLPSKLEIQCKTVVYLILLGIPSSLILSFMNRGWG